MGAKGDLEPVVSLSNQTTYAERANGRYVLYLALLTHRNEVLAMTKLLKTESILRITIFIFRKLQCGKMSRLLIVFFKAD